MKVVGERRRFGRVEGEAVGSVGSETAVANVRETLKGDRGVVEGDACMQRSLGILEAILLENEIESRMK